MFYICIRAKNSALTCLLRTTPVSDSSNWSVFGIDAYQVRHFVPTMVILWSKYQSVQKYEYRLVLRQLLQADSET